MSRYKGKHRMTRYKRPSIAVTAVLLAAVLIRAGAPPAAMPTSPFAEPSISTLSSFTLDEEIDVIRVKAQQQQRAVQAVAAARAERIDRAKKVAAARAKAKAAQRAADRARWNKGWSMPLKAHWVITSRYGARPPMHFHTGLDFAVPVGTKVFAMSTGRVIFAGRDNTGFGNLIKIRYADGTIIYYGHLSKFLIRPGAWVTRGQPVALSGSTGYSTGPHLHIDVHPHGGGPVNPEPWLRAHGLRI